LLRWLQDGATACLRVLATARRAPAGGESLVRAADEGCCWPIWLERGLGPSFWRPRPGRRRRRDSGCKQGACRRIAWGFGDGHELWLQYASLRALFRQRQGRTANLHCCHRISRPAAAEGPARVVTLPTTPCVAAVARCKLQPMGMAGSVWCLAASIRRSFGWPLGSVLRAAGRSTGCVRVPGESWLLASNADRDGPG